MKKLLSVFMLVATAFAGFTRGESSEVALNLKPRQSASKTKRQTCPDASQIIEQNIHCNLQGKVAPHLPVADSFSVNASILVWQAKQENLHYGLQWEVPLASGGFPDITGKYEIKPLNLDFEWAPGLQLGIGYVFGPQDNWDISLNWTYFYNKGKGHKVKPPTTDRLYTTWFPGQLGGWAADSFGAPTQTASAQWNLVYNTLDLSIGRDYFISKKIALHPFAGLRGAFIYQDYKVKYENTQFANFLIGNGEFIGLPSNFANTKMSAENDFMAIGFRTGANFFWHFTNHVGLYSKFSGAIVYGHFDVDQDFVTAQQALTPAQGVLAFPGRKKLDEDLNRLRANFETSMGLVFETDFGCANHLFVTLGYDFSIWLNQLQLSDLIDSTSPIQPIANGQFTQVSSTIQDRRYGDLMLQGFSASVQLNF